MWGEKKMSSLIEYSRRCVPTITASAIGTFYAAKHHQRQPLSECRRSAHAIVKMSHNFNHNHLNYTNHPISHQIENYGSHWWRRLLRSHSLSDHIRRSILRAIFSTTAFRLLRKRTVKRRKGRQVQILTIMSWSKTSWPLWSSSSSDGDEIKRALRRLNEGGGSAVFCLRDERWKNLSLH